MGEMHIQDPNVIPNAKRDGFEDGNEWTSICNRLVEFARLRSRAVRQLSQARNVDIERLVGAAERERELAVTRRTVFSQD